MIVTKGKEINRGNIKDGFAFFTDTFTNSHNNAYIPRVISKCRGENIAIKELDVSAINSYADNPYKYTLIVVREVNEQILSFVQNLMQYGLDVCCIHQVNFEGEKSNYIFAETNDVLINEAFKWIAEKSERFKNNNCSEDCKYKSLCEETFFCAKKFIQGISGGTRCLKNVADIFACTDGYYYLTFYKKFKALKNIVTHRGQVFIDKCKDGSDKYYIDFKDLSLTTIEMRAWAKKSTSNIWQKVTPTENACGKQLINFSISLQELGLGVNDEYELLYTYKIPCTHFGSYLTRSFSCFRETVQVDFQSDVALSAEDINLCISYVDDFSNAEKERYIEIQNTDTAIRRDQSDSILYGILGEDFVKNNRLSVTENVKLATNITTLGLKETCAKIKVSWDSSKIFKGDFVTKGNSPSKPSEV